MLIQSSYRHPIRPQPQAAIEFHAEISVTMYAVAS